MFAVPVKAYGDLSPPGRIDYGFDDKAGENASNTRPIIGAPYLPAGALKPAKESATVPDEPIEASRFRLDQLGDYVIGTPFDMGSRLELRISERGSSTLGNIEEPFERRLYPSFQTYNIVRHYRLAWAIELKCAGELSLVTSEVDVKILPPSGEEENTKRRKLGAEGMEAYHDNFMQDLGIRMVGRI
jgi:hypothetical protein